MPKIISEREVLANLIPLDLVHDRGREGFPQNTFEVADTILAAGFRRRSVVKDLEQNPPTGWQVFGTNVDYSGPLEFYGEQFTEDGLPLWERRLIPIKSRS